MNRRDFLMVTGLFILGGKTIGDFLIEMRNKKIVNNIYYELPKHIHIAEISGEILIDKETAKIWDYGCGIILNNQFLTMAHVTDLSVLNDKEAGTNKFEVEIKNKKVKLYDKELEEAVFDIESDIAIYNIPPKLNIPNFPCNISNDIMLSDEIYIVGNPSLSGINVRRGYVSDLDSILKKEDLSVENCFGVDKILIPGDSGTPVVNSDYELLGLCAFSISDGLGYVKRIEEFIKRI